MTRRCPGRTAEVWLQLATAGVGPPAKALAREKKTANVILSVVKRQFDRQKSPENAILIPFKKFLAPRAGFDPEGKEGTSHLIPCPLTP